MGKKVLFLKSVVWLATHGIDSGLLLNNKMTKQVKIKLNVFNFPNDLAFNRIY